MNQIRSIAELFNRGRGKRGNKFTQNPNYGLNKEIKVQLRRGKQGKLEYFSNN